MKWLKWIRRIGGIVLFVSGVFSLVLPVIPGWLMIVLGLYLLSIDSPGIQRRLDALCVRYPLCARMRESSHRLFRHKPKTDAE